MSDHEDDSGTGDTQKSKKVVVLVATALVLALGGGAAAWYFVMERADRGNETDDAPKRNAARGEGPEAEPIPQARWKIRVDPVGIRNVKPSKKEEVRVDERGRQIGDLVRDLYNTLFFRRTQLRKEILDLFTKKAGHAVLQPEFGFPPAATKVRTFRREADIGVEYERAQEAGVKIVVSVRAHIDDKVVRVVHRATLWLEREEGRWQVVAFEAEQERVM